MFCLVGKLVDYYFNELTNFLTKKGGLPMLPYIRLEEWQDGRMAGK
jgi:hypothetical protein